MNKKKEKQSELQQIVNNGKISQNLLSINHKINLHLSRSCKNSIVIAKFHHCENSKNFEVNKALSLDNNNNFIFSNQIIAKACSKFYNIELNKKYDFNQKECSLINNLNHYKYKEINRVYSSKKNNILGNKHKKYSLKRIIMDHYKTKTINSNYLRQKNENPYKKLILDYNYTYNNLTSEKLMNSEYNEIKNNKYKSKIKNNVYFKYNNLYPESKEISPVDKNKTLSEYLSINSYQSLRKKKMPRIDSRVSDYYEIKNNKYNFFKSPLITQDLIPFSKESINSVKFFLRKKIIKNCIKTKYHTNKNQNIGNKNNAEILLNNNKDLKTVLFTQYIQNNRNNDLIYKPIKININNKMIFEEKNKNIINHEKEGVFQIKSNSFREKNINVIKNN